MIGQRWKTNYEILVHKLLPVTDDSKNLNYRRTVGANYRNEKKNRKTGRLNKVGKVHKRYK